MEPKTLLVSTPGFYIAWGPWLDVEHGPGQLHKVGHSGELGARLSDSAYMTCFPPDHWRYVATFELATKDEAALLETAVLHCCRHWRLGPRELVRGPLDELVRLATAAAVALGLNVVHRTAPAYAPAGRALGAPASAPTLEHAAWPEKRAVIETLTRPAPAPAPTPAPTYADLIEELLALDLSGLSEPAVVAPAELAPLLEPAPVEPEPAPPTMPAPSAELELAVLADQDDVGDLGDLGELSATSSYAPQALEERDYQQAASAACLTELRRSGRAILQMACRCGKTPVAYRVVDDFLQAAQAQSQPHATAALYLVPGLALLRQTAQKLAAYGCSRPMLLVGSDPKPVTLADGRELTMTTDPAAIRAFVCDQGGPRLVLCTYQSSAQVRSDDLSRFAIAVFDEAHRVCGGGAPRPFNYAIKAIAAVPAHARPACLFMTATPAYDSLKSAAAITMKDRALFGGVAYRYYLRQGIAAGHVNDFRLELVAAPAASTAPLPDQLFAAMAQVDKLLVFCRDIKHATQLAAAVQAAQRPAGVEPFECLVAHSRMPAGGATAALQRFGAPGRRAALFNCRLCQEGVEIPALNGVFFAAPRHSPRDIIQSVCRPLNHADGKPPSVVFLPVAHDPQLAADDPANLKRFASIVPFVDALLDEDPRLYEHLLNPTAADYPLSITGTHSLQWRSGSVVSGVISGAHRRSLLSAVRRAVRYNGSTAARPIERLLRADTIPWDVAFGELRRVVEACGRYPKTTDLIVVGDARANLHGIYRAYATQYERAQRGELHTLEPYQIAALAALPGWEPYGMQGPYPWAQCMAFLRQWLATHGEVPRIEINVGGYVGLEATPMERLSGCLTCINQGDGRRRANGGVGSGFTISAEKQADLAAVCAPYGLRWRKERDENGDLVEDGPQTFIQEAYARFKAYYKEHGSSGAYIQQWFPGYPLKHRRQENLEVQASRVAPPRRAPKRAPKAAAVK